jgi:hypothetical protein
MIVAIAACTHSPITKLGPVLTVESVEDSDDVDIIGNLAIFELYQLYIRIAIACSKRKQRLGNEKMKIFEEELLPFYRFLLSQGREGVGYTAVGSMAFI